MLFLSIKYAYWYFGYLLGKINFQKLFKIANINIHNILSFYKLYILGKIVKTIIYKSGTQKT